MSTVLERQQFVEKLLVAEFRNEGFEVIQRENVVLASIDGVPMNITRMAIDLERGIRNQVARILP
jgi:hypothetical protein